MKDGIHFVMEDQCRPSEGGHLEVWARGECLGQMTSGSTTVVHGKEEVFQAVVYAWIVGREFDLDMFFNKA